MKIKNLLAMLCFTFVAHGAQASNIHVTVDNIDEKNARPSDVEVLKALIRSEIRNNSDFELVEGQGEGTISGSLIRLESNYILQLRLTRPGQATRAKQTKAENFNEMDVAVRRLLKALAHGANVEDTVSRGEALQKEQQTPSRVKSIHSTEIFVGVGAPLSNIVTPKPALAAAGLGYMWDVRHFLIETRADFMTAINGQGIAEITGALGASYVLVEGDTASLFLGPEFGFGFALSSWSNVMFGFHVAGDLGVILLREADVNLDIRLRLGVLTKQFQNTGSVPVFGALLFGLHF